VVNLVAEWLALLLLGRGRLLHQALVDLLEVLLPSLDEVLLLRARPIEVLQLVRCTAWSGRDLVAILLQVHFELVLAEQQVLRRVRKVGTLVQLHKVPLLVLVDALVGLQVLGGTLAQDGLVALSIEVLLLVHVSLWLGTTVEVNVLLYSIHIRQLHLL